MGPARPTLRAPVRPFAGALAISVALAAGCSERVAPDPPDLIVEDRAAGAGRAAAVGDHVTYVYTVRLLGSSSVVDSNVGKAPYPVDIGHHKVIAGMEQGLVGMRVGGKRHLVIPSRLAYGAAGKPGRVPPNAPLDFEIELLTIDPASPASTAAPPP